MVSYFCPYYYLYCQETAAQEAALLRLRDLEVLRERERVEAEAVVLKLSLEKDHLLAIAREAQGQLVQWCRICLLRSLYAQIHLSLCPAAFYIDLRFVPICFLPSISLSLSLKYYHINILIHEN